MKHIRLANGDVVLYDENQVGNVDVKSYEREKQFSGTDFPVPPFLVNKTEELYSERLDKVRRKNQTADFKSELSDNSQVKEDVANRKAQKPGIYLNSSAVINDDEIPNSFKAIGGKVVRETVFFDVSFDANGNPSYKGDDNSVSNSLTRGLYFGDKTIKMFDIVGRFSDDDGKIISEMKTEYDALKAAGEKDIQGKLAQKFPDSRSLNMFTSYLQNFSNEPQAKEGFNTTLFHEIKHAQTDDYLTAFELRPNSGETSLENKTRLMEDDEKSAVLASVFKNIDNYFKNGEDESVFENYTSEFCVLDSIKKIRAEGKSNGKSEDEIKQDIKAYLTDHKQVAKDVIKDWDDNIAPLYKEIGDTNNQFQTELTAWAENHPSHKIGDNDSENDPEYLKQRKLIYQFSVLDPETGKMVPVNLAEDIKHAKIDDKFMDNVINPCKDKVKKRKEKVDPELLDYAKYINREEWDLAKDRNDIEDEVLNISGYDPNNPPEPDPNIDDEYVVKLDKFYRKSAADKGYTYNRDATSKIYSATIKKEDGRQTIVQANAENNISLGAKDKDGKPSIPDYEDFLDIAKRAKEGNMVVNFGNIKSPEYKARLLAACLEQGVEIKNVPKKEDLKDVSIEMKTKILRHAVKNKSLFPEIDKDPERAKVDSAREELREARKNGQQEPEEARKIIEERQRRLSGGR
ncbi:MAG: hypothetical protein R3Y43_03260 [Alphaproteobacteria bacterium]